MIPNRVEVRLESPVFNSFRCQMACDALDIDIAKKSVHHLVIDGINIPDEWNVGLIYGASGSGKTSMAKSVFGPDIFKTILDEQKPIIEQLPEALTYDECSALLTGIGLNSVPCWVRPVNTLSNGQRARAEAALLMSNAVSGQVVCIDEWTSVVDRTVAKAMSHCLQKFARRFNKRIILLSCHNDVIEWLLPDFLIDCNEQRFIPRENDNFFFTERERLQFDIRKIGRQSWKYFSKYHYLSENLPGGIIHLYGLFHENKQIGFQCFANYTPKKPGKAMIFHSNRTVIHPDYQGLGLGIKVINETSRVFHVENPSFKIMAKFSSLPVYKAMIKQPEWVFTGTKRLMGKQSVGGNIDRKSGYRECGVRTFHFEYKG